MAVQGASRGPSSAAPPSAPRSPVAAQNKRPEVLWPVLAVLLLVVQLVATMKGTFGANALAAVSGLFISVVLLGIARAREAKRRADGRFTDWGFIGAGSFMSLATLASWALGVANVFFVAKEFTR